MKTWMMLAFGGMMAILGCQGQQAQTDSGLLTADSAYYAVSDSQLQCKIYADVPAEPVAQAVGEWLDEVLGGTYDGDVRGVQALVDYYGKTMTDSLRQSGGMPVAYEVEMRKAYETEEIVTYVAKTYSYWGGAHPSASEEGATFRKSDGRKLGWDVIRRSEQYAMQTLIVESLKTYLDVATDKELEDATNRSVYAIPLPQTPPYVLETGVAFIYQQYELGSYAIGMPAGVIAYDRIVPMMTTWAAHLIQPDK